MPRLCFNIPCIVLFQCIFFYCASVSVTRSNNETDFQALLAFKKAIDRDPQGALISWNETSHVCTWKGIFCSRRHRNRVTGVNLRSQGLIGSLSPHLGNLTFLRFIVLQNNSFYGKIPDEIGRLRRLEWVELSNNSISGDISRNLSQCINIYYLNLIDNNLIGIIPLELNSLVKLESLGLSLNNLTGTIPPFIGNFTSLLVLSLSSCEMQGEIPESLVQLKSLELLNLASNNLTGRVPYGLFNISTLSILEMRSNRLQGTIHPEIGSSSSSLRYLYLGENNFTGEIPISLSNFSSLEDIYLSLNNFTGRMTMDFSRLSALGSVLLSTNNLEGDLSFISSMVNCTRLTYLDISSNLLSGLLPHSVANLSSNLSYLSLGGNRLHGRIPSTIGNLLGLTSFDLDHNNFDGPIPSEIGKLSMLGQLDLGGNILTNEIPFSFGNLTLLNYLFLGQNTLSGNIPQALANCTNLFTLDISHNNLNGTIPREIVSLSSISQYFDLSYNAFTGSIPLEVGSLINLMSIDLSHNTLSGLIPHSLSSCVRLERIYLEHNSLSGEIPDAIRTLRGVQFLDLSQNNISGEISRFFGGLDLLYLNLSFNRLQGEVPAIGVFLNESAISLEGNDELCGGIPFLEFPPCPRRKHFSIVLKIWIPLISFGAICICIALCLYIFVCRRRGMKNNQSSTSLLEAEILRVSYADLLKATGRFSEENLLGRGRFGSVYKGTLNDRQIPVAVKVLNLNTKGASRSFVSECNALRGIRHRNLVKLMSVCSSTDFQGNDFKALVYELMENGNLDEWLHLKSEEGSDHDLQERSNLNTKQRLSIAIDIAFALEYLHFGTDSVIIHGDLKPNNILLDEQMTAYVGDFGLAKVVSNILSAHESSSIGIKGTIGYIPPEYGMSGMVSTEGDVYSYGILLLEMFTGRRPTDDEFQDSLSLRGYARSVFPDQVMEVVDPIILQEYNHRMNMKVKNSLVSVLEIGLACSQESAGDRITMTDVVNKLRKTLHMTD